MGLGAAAGPGLPTSVGLGPGGGGAEAGAAVSGCPAAGEGRTLCTRGVVIREVLINLILWSYSKWDFFPSHSSQQAQSKSVLGRGGSQNLVRLSWRWRRRALHAGSPGTGAGLGLLVKCAYTARTPRRFKG